ncbi:hypothetical protein HDV00_001231 [Rhizophlyctis rosea]|nr:hypothetical protein HDV00_001231 [Rhizophlyctis rosea]
MGVPLEDYAQGGATTDNTFVAGVEVLPNNRTLSIPSVADQVTTYLKSPPTSASSTLYVIWAGANNFFVSLGQKNTSVLTTQFRTQLTNDLASSAKKLIAAGAKNVVIFTLPPMESTPAGQGLSPTVLQTAEVVLQQTNQGDLLGSFKSQAIQNITLTTSQVRIYDIYSVFHAITSTPAQYKIVNATSPCLINYGEFDSASTSSATPQYCSNPDGYVFWDAVHPTTSAHRVLANNFTQWLVKPKGGSAGGNGGTGQNSAGLRVAPLAVMSAFVLLALVVVLSG